MNLNTDHWLLGDPAGLCLLPRHLEIVQTLLRQHLPDAEIWAYGSRVTGRGHEASDLDLVVRNPADPLKEIPGITELKETFAESDLPIRVDVVEWARIPERFRQMIRENYLVVQKG